MFHAPKTLPGLRRHYLKVASAFSINIVSGLRIPMDPSVLTGREHVWEKPFILFLEKQELSDHTGKARPAVPISWTLMI